MDRRSRDLVPQRKRVQECLVLCDHTHYCGELLKYNATYFATKIQILECAAINLILVYAILAYIRVKRTSVNNLRVRAALKLLSVYCTLIDEQCS